ncbi:hypothetical protein FBQ99_21110 [Chloroflexi bacterium CFX2]|nr:hypothetical protein [Chloroflexi bacterium CFX2]
MAIASKLTLAASGIFFLTGLLTGIWKYISIVRSEKREAPRYVNVAHQASLMYAFAALLLLKFLEFSPYTDTVNLLAVAFPLLFFALAIATYIAHGILQDTDNQFQEPFRLGRILIPPPLFHLFVWLLIIAEVGGFLVLFMGFLSAQVLK